MRAPHLGKRAERAQKIDSGVEYDRHNFSLLTGIPPDVLDRLDKVHGFETGYVMKVRQIADYVLEDSDARRPYAKPMQIEAGSQKYKDVMTFLNNDLVLQRVLSMVSFGLAKQNKVGPTLYELQEWIADIRGESGREETR